MLPGVKDSPERPCKEALLRVTAIVNDAEFWLRMAALRMREIGRYDLSVQTEETADLLTVLENSIQHRIQSHLDDAK